MRVLLVSTYELGHQPLHVASAAAFLRAAGHEVRAADLAVEDLDDGLVDWAGLVGVAVPMHTATRLALPVVRRIRARRGDLVRIVLYGLYAPLCADSVGHGADHLVGGEYEAELVAIAGGAASGRRVILDRLSFPAPERDLLPPLSRYARLLVGDRALPAGYVEASRGCVHRCRHCPIPPVYDGRIRIRGRDSVVADVDALVELGAAHVSFGDPDFLNAVPHALAVVEAVHRRHPELTFDVTAKVEHLLRHRGAVERLASQGLVFVVSAVESLSDRVLDILDKGHTGVDAQAAVQLCRELGVSLRPSLLPFTPWSDLADHLALLDFIDSNALAADVDPVQLTIRLLLPQGSLLLGHPEMTPHLDGYDPASLSWRWHHPDPAMDALQERLAGLVAADTDAGADPADTHRRIRAVSAQAAQAAGLDWTPATPGDPRPPGPRLSEAWFCCAEPTLAQLGAAGGG